MTDKTTTYRKMRGMECRSHAGHNTRLINRLNFCSAETGGDCQCIRTRKLKKKDEKNRRSVDVDKLNREEGGESYHLKKKLY